MQTIYSAEFMKDNCGCYKEESGRLELMVLKGRKEISYLDIIESGIPLKDKYWFFCENIFTKEQNQRISVIIAEIVLPIYEEKYPDSKAPREAIEAAKLYIKGEITLEQLMVKRRAAAAAATYAAYNAADDAASAAASASAYAAAADAADDSYTQKLEKALMDFIERAREQGG